jgi:hypothetical protein
MTRAELVAYLGEQFATLLDAAGILPADMAAGLQMPVNQALRRLGVSAAGPISDALSEAAEALGEFHTLRRIRAALGASTEIEAQNARASKSQLFNQVTALLEDAAARCAALGYAPTTQGTSSGGVTPATAFRVGLDFIEPEPYA